MVKGEGIMRDSNIENILTDRVVALLLNDEQVRNGIGRADRQQAVISLLSEQDFKEKVQGFVTLLSETSQSTLANNQAIKDNSTSNLAISIGRAMVNIGLNKDGSAYQAESHEAATSNFYYLDKSKFETKENNLGEEIASLMQKNSKELNYNKKLNPINIQLALATAPTPESNNNEKIANLAAGIIAKVAGQKSPFKNEKDFQYGKLPQTTVCAIYGAAVKLASDPNLNEKQMMLKGKELGKVIRDKLYQEKDNQNIFKLTDVIVDEAKSLGISPAAKTVESSNPEPTPIKRREADIEALIRDAHPASALTPKMRNEPDLNKVDELGSRMIATRERSGSFSEREKQKALEAQHSKGSLSKR